MSHTPVSKTGKSIAINAHNNQQNIIMKSGRTLHNEVVNKTTSDNYCAALRKDGVDDKGMSNMVKKSSKSSKEHSKENEKEIACKVNEIPLDAIDVETRDFSKTFWGNFQTNEKKNDKAMNQNNGGSKSAMSAKAANEVNDTKTDQYNKVFNGGDNKSKRSNAIKTNLKEQELDVENEFLKEMCKHKESDSKDKPARETNLECINNFMKKISKERILEWFEQELQLRMFDKSDY